MITSHGAYRAHRVFAFGVCMVVLGSVVLAQARSWTHPDGTSHWYEAVAVPAGITWSEANRAAATAGGHLATITSSEENTAVVAVIQDTSLWSGQNGPWIGGVRSSATPNAWGWGELDPFAFAAWASGHPASSAGFDRIHYGGSASTSAGTWASAPAASKNPGFVIEYAGPTVPRTMGLLRRDPGSFDGYTLFSPLPSRKTYLLDPRGRAVNTWTSSYLPGMVAYLLPNGSLLRSGSIGSQVFTVGGNGGIVEKFDWQGNLVWQFQHSSETYCLHHDIEQLPNGNVLMIAWELKTKAEAISAGRDPNLLTDGGVWSEKIIEVQATGKDSGSVVWEWHVWDHLIQDVDPTKANYGVVAKRPERIDLNYTLVDGRPDWLHANAVAYNPKLDQIILSVRSFCEIWVIDHGTTTKEAAQSSGGKRGRGGDLLYRWGNAAAYRAGEPHEQLLLYQHDAHWIAEGLPGAGNILVFNNGTGRDFSSVDEIVPPLDTNGTYRLTNGVFGPTGAKWSYVSPTPRDFFSQFVSGAQRLPNGNTLVCCGMDGRFFEVKASGKTVWEYVNPDSTRGISRQGDTPGGNAVFRAPRYAADYPGLKGRTLTTGEPIEKHAVVLLVEGSTLPHRVQPGTAVKLSLRAGNHPGRGYMVATSATSGLLQLDYRFLRMGWDPILAASIWQAAPTVFQNYAGFLDAKGLGNATLAIPDFPALVGVKLQSAFLVHDPKARSTLGMISNTVVVEIGTGF